MQLHSAITVLMGVLPLTSAWSLTVNTADNWCGSRRTCMSSSYLDPLHPILSTVVPRGAGGFRGTGTAPNYDNTRA